MFVAELLACASVSQPDLPYGSSLKNSSFFFFFTHNTFDCVCNMLTSKATQTR